MTQNEQTGADKPSASIGPILFFRSYDDERLKLVALVLYPTGQTAGDLTTELGTFQAETLVTRAGYDAVRYSFDLPAGGVVSYQLDGASYEVNTRFTGDLDFAYVSCNGQEDGDLDRDEADRNRLWARLSKMQKETPFQLLLQGGDQIYADEVTKRHPLSHDWPEEVPDTLDQAQKSAVREALSTGFFEHYAQIFGQSDIAYMAARVPTLAMWDDHDICDGWGSLPLDRLDSDVGKILFETARVHFLLFQFGVNADEVPDICADREGQSLGWSVKLPDLQLIAPDLRSERRPNRVMADRGWEVLRGYLADETPGRRFMLSSVPALGPRLSIVEFFMGLSPRMEKYEDDLRDQWQSRAHRKEWAAFLEDLMKVHRRPDAEMTVVSGEIHLATRGEMQTEDGPIHQLVASGITHPVPIKSYPQILGLLARLGEAPVKGHPIRLKPIPGAKTIYTAERNFLTLSRADGDWFARWHLEESGTTPALAI
ncbi:alkaline phosphatase D family protein [Litoreibacter roseus]|uniref:Metallophosphatase n=1 Tax=Litoreibacter roseus TaxID=2601869 RepID=A0A6N6JAH0_9RHOB|nr:alkaline phosphatase D family protein [Litoreibacter roseus]GFE62987.1 metallophosphatase [Litoreibacter roseus]